MMVSSRLNRVLNPQPLRKIIPFAVLPDAVGSLSISGLTSDSRNVKRGDLFVALPGLNANGADYISQAVDAGAVAAVRDGDGLSADAIRYIADSVPVIAVNHLSERLSSMAANFYGCPANEMSVYGVTGTNGKTTCCYLLGQLLAMLTRPTGVIGTLGFGVIDGSSVNQNGFPAGMVETGFTTPDAIESQAIFHQLKNQDVTTVVMEVSSHSLVQSRIAAVPVSVALFTNLSQDHLDYHGTMEAYADAKAKLFAMPSVAHAIVNIDDDFGLKLSAAVKVNGKNCLTYSIEDDSADIYARSIQAGSNGTRVAIKTPWGDGMFHTALIGRFNVSNLLVIIGAACVGTNVTLADVLAGVAGLVPVPGRMQSIAAANRLVVIDYAHTPDALQNTLETLRPYTSGKLCCVFGCGGDRDKTKRPKMGAIAEQLADQLYITSDNPRTESATDIMSDIVAGVLKPEKLRVQEDRAQAIRSAIHASAPGDVILIAGKGHETYQIVGTKKHYFNDVEFAQLALAEIGAAYD